MPEKTLNEIPRSFRDFYERGQNALLRNNLDYAVTMFTQVLEAEPAFYACREALRKAQFKKSGGVPTGTTSFFKKVIGGAGASPLIAKAQISMRKDPLEAIKVAEQILNNDPMSTAAHKIVAEAALAADLPKTAILSLELLVRNAPKDQDLIKQLAEAHAQVGDTKRAEALYTELVRANPNDQETLQALKNLTARQTLKEGGYDSLADGKGSYRDILKDKDEAVRLEQANREVKTEDVSGRLIGEYTARLASEPNNMRLMRNIAELYSQQKDFAKALDFYTRIQAAEGNTDPSLEKAISDTRLKQMDAQINVLPPDDPQRAALEAERQRFQIEECKQRVERYPTDLQIRFELGELLFHSGRTSEAIAEFQKAQSNPARRLASLVYLGQCFARRNMNDLAARTLQNALKEKQAFDDEKKDIIYVLGCVLEKMGKKEEAMDQFKQIYESDIGYKDVAAKVDAYYAAQGG